MSLNSKLKPTWLRVTSGVEDGRMSPHLHVGLKIVFASTAKRTQGTLVAFQACVDDHVSLPVALAFDDQSTHRTLEWFATILRRALRALKNNVTTSSPQCNQMSPTFSEL